ncbi:hypothetical protein CRG98_037607 [Punica granatum]|uniref:Uncharacterized protein n=1 Tax=Punica granatum TaxID=22663 RepID=A0A2I0IDE0_PUNGR|nr:hypothetical protein CRG98_037607 [Punica granatum]
MRPHGKVDTPKPRDPKACMRAPTRVYIRIRTHAGSAILRSGPSQPKPRPRRGRSPGPEPFLPPTLPSLPSRPPFLSFFPRTNPNFSSFQSKSSIHLLLRGSINDAASSSSDKLACRSFHPSSPGYRAVDTFSGLAATPSFNRGQGRGFRGYVLTTHFEFHCGSLAAMALLICLNVKLFFFYVEYMRMKDVHLDAFVVVCHL